MQDITERHQVALLKTGRVHAATVPNSMPVAHAQMREQAVAVLASAFRSLSCAAAARLLRLEEPPEAARQVLALLQASAAHGCAGAGRALSLLQVAERAPDASAVLAFRS